MTTQPTTDRPRTPRVLLTVEQAADAIGVGRTTMYALIKTGALKAVKVGRLRRVPQAELQAYTDRLITEQNTNPQG